MPTSVDREDLKSIPYELFMLGLAVLSIVNLLLVGVLSWGPQPWWLVVYVDIILTAFFLGDFAFRLVTASSKKHCLGRGGGILDLLSCSPGLRILRLFRIVRAVRIIRRLGGAQMLGELRGQLGAGTRLPGFLANTFLSMKLEHPVAPPTGDAQAALKDVERLMAEPQRAIDALKAQITG